MSADTPDVLTACECGHSIDRHHAGTQRGECRTYNCFCTLKPSDVFAARVAAERERGDAAEAKIADAWDEGALRIADLLGCGFDSDHLARLNPYRATLGGEATPRPLPLHRTEAGYPNCSTCDGGGCPDCTDPA